MLELQFLAARVASRRLPVSTFVLALTCLVACLPASDAAAQTIDERIDALLSDMTLEEKIGQMTQVTLAVVAQEGSGPYDVRLDPAKLRTAIVDHHVGSILNVADHANTVEHWHELITEIQDVATNETRLGIPVIYGIDAVHGANYLTGATIFPHNLGLAATFDTSLARKAGAIAALETRISGVPWNFAPVLDLGRHPAWPRFYETFGEDVLLAGRMGAATVRGMQEDDLEGPDVVATTAKHYVGYSFPVTGKDRTTALIPELELREYFLPPFEAAIDAGVMTVMVNSGDVNRIPVHASRFLLTEVLRGELGFDGVIVTDWEDIIKMHRVHHTAANRMEATLQALDAGIDMAMVPNDFSFYEDALELVNEGAVTEERIDASVRRILRLKLELGLFDAPFPGEYTSSDVNTEAFEAVNLEAARRSMTLLKNEGGLLPLADGVRVLVTGPAANSMTALNGGWTYTWQGRDASRFPDDKPTLLEALRAQLGDEAVTYVEGPSFDGIGDEGTVSDAGAGGAPGTEAAIAAAVTAARDADVAIVAIGEDAYAETPGNIDDLSLPVVQRDLVTSVAATGTPVVVVLVEGRPRILEDAADAADAVLMAYWPGMQGGRAIADVLTGVVNPSGRLPFTYPRAPNALLPYDHPVSSSFGIWLSERNAFNPQWPFGAGLSYTRFVYDSLAISNDRIAPGEDLEVTVSVTNAGDRPGREIVLVYVADEFASVAPPVRRLRAFRPVDLQPGASQEVTFSVPASDLAFVGPANEWVLEPGTFRIEVGGLSAQFEVIAEE